MKITQANWPGVARLVKRSEMEPSPRAGMLGSSFDAATYGRRTIGWGGSGDGPNTALLGTSDTLRIRSRQAVRNNAWAGNASETFASELIGAGIKPKSNHPTASKKLALQKQWLAWTDYADADGINDFYGMQALAVRSVVDGGECFIRKRYRKLSAGLAVPFQVQLLEAEHCPVWKNGEAPGGNYIRQGIEFNADGDRVAYWLYPIHPGETSGWNIAPSNDPIRVPAAQILHIFRRTRPEQHRGEPWLARALAILNDLDSYIDAELQRKKTAAMFAGWITENDSADSAIPSQSSFLPGLDGYGQQAPLGTSFAEMEPGTFTKLGPNESITFSEPADVGPNYEAFLKSQLRRMFAGVGLSYDQGTGDLSDVNYSSIRAGLLKIRRQMEQIQHQLVVFQMCRPLWREVIESSVFAGAFKARDYRNNQDSFLDVSWIPDGWKSIDAQKDADANKTNLRLGLTSPQKVVSADGEDFEQVLADYKAALDLADKNGIVFDWDARQTSTSGMRPAGKDPTNPDGLQNPTQVPSDQQLAQSGAAQQATN